jgi:predicted AAA+ superfamily ATPase
MPELTKIDTDAQKMSYLQTMFQTIIYKDIVKRYTIKDIAYLEKLMQYLADIVGSPVSLRNIVDASVQAGWGDPSLATISNYLHYLQQPYLVHKVRRFDIKGKKILEHNEKYYFNDIGMRNFFKVDMQRDIGKLVENIVYLHLRKCGYTVYVGMIDGKEIDFIAEKGKKRCYIQATYMMPNS